MTAPVGNHAIRRFINWTRLSLITYDAVNLDRMTVRKFRKDPERGLFRCKRMDAILLARPQFGIRRGECTGVSLRNTLVEIRKQVVWLHKPSPQFSDPIVCVVNPAMRHRQIDHSLDMTLRLPSKGLFQRMTIGIREIEGFQRLCERRFPKRIAVPRRL